MDHGQKLFSGSHKVVVDYKYESFNLLINDWNSIYNTRSKFNSIKKSQRIFRVICEASAEWNRIFSFPALAIISSKLLTSSFCVFNFIQGLISPNVYLSMVRWLVLNSFLGDIVLMAIVFVTADIPVQEVN